MSMQGYLKKRNERGVWQQRWFVLQGLELKYYNSQKDATGGKDPKGVIPVMTVQSAEYAGAIGGESGGRRRALLAIGGRPGGGWCQTFFAKPRPDATAARPALGAVARVGDSTSTADASAALVALVALGVVAPIGDSTSTAGAQ